MNEEHFLNLQPGTIVNGRYEVVKCLGTGSMGMVYACRHRELAGHLVAMKVLFSEVARDTVAAQRFRNEIVASYGVSHPNVVRAYEYFRDGDLVAFTMEYIGGGDLADRIGRDEAIPINEIIRMLGQMCSGVQAIHDAGIIHRDLKPENILLTAQGDIKITDFGIARTGTGPKLTEHGGVVGTIDYVSPEYLERGQVDARSDIYALGVLAFEMITGEAPFKGKSVIETMTLRLRTDPPIPSSLRPDCPKELDAIILKAMRRDPEERYQTGMQVLTDLQAISSMPLVNFSSSRMPTVSAEELSTLSKSVGDALGEQKQKSRRRGSSLGHRARAKFDELRGNLATTQAFDPQFVKRVSASAQTDVHQLQMAGGGDVQPMESVLRPSPSPSSLNATEPASPPPSVVVGRSHFSAERMKELSMDLYPDEAESVFKNALYWLLIVLVGFGLGILGLRHYKPELFGNAEKQAVPTYNNLE